MFELSITTRAVFGDRSCIEGIDTVSSLGLDAVEIYDWDAHNPETIQEHCDNAGVNLIATVSIGAGGVIADAGPAMTNPDTEATAIEDIRKSIELCESLNCPNLILTLGPEQQQIERSAQRETVISILQSVSQHAAAADITIVIEPLNTRIDHPGYYLEDSQEAFDIVDEVNSTAVKVLYDIYHQQVTEGNIIDTITENIDQVGHIHIADVPGRQEPGTGELNFQNIFQAIAETGYDRYVGCEFFPLADPEQAIRDVQKLLDTVEGS